MYTALIETFKDIMTPYMSLLLVHIVELLRTFMKGNFDKLLWLSCIENLENTFEADDGGEHYVALSILPPFNVDQSFGGRIGCVPFQSH